jgi:uncharacterized linocin/CFP29 family protein
MHADLVELGWTEEQWNRIVTTVTEEAQKARLAAQVLPVVGPEAPTTIALPNFTLTKGENPPPNEEPEYAKDRLKVDSDPTLYLTTIAINVQLRTVEVADPELKAALVMFRRAANHIARIEDALIFNGRPGPDKKPQFGVNGIPDVYTVHGHSKVNGIFIDQGVPDPADSRIYLAIGAPDPDGSAGQPIVNAVVDAISQLEANGQLGPFACILGHQLFHDVCDPTSNLVLPRDRILPFLEGPLRRSSAIATNWGAVIALSGNPVEIVVATDINVRFLQTTLEPRFVFRVSERVALRIEETKAIAVLRKPLES